MVNRKDWKWFGNAGHLCVGRWCRFHLCTQVGNYLVSTVGQYWPERPAREVHAQVHDPKWLAKHGILRGDNFDAKYLEHFGYEDIGCDRKFETMVFKTTGKICSEKSCDCGMPLVADWGELDADAYNDAGSATQGHMKMCKKWAKKEAE